LNLKFGANNAYYLNFYVHKAPVAFISSFVSTIF